MIITVFDCFRLTVLTLASYLKCKLSIVAIVSPESAMIQRLRVSDEGTSPPLSQSEAPPPPR